jgi:SAM-dependent methyltransferase
MYHHQRGAISQRRVSVTEWFEQWFGEEYLRLYPHRDEDDAAEAVALIVDNVRLEESRVLDLACGPGRHAIQLRSEGAWVVGFDLSLPLLSRARHRDPDPLYVVRGDMRYLPFARGSFDVVVNLFTSFGYFSDDRQHGLVLTEVATVLRPGGVLVLDYFNTADLMGSLVSHEERAIGNQRVVIERRISDDGRYVLKEMHLLNDGRSFLERVRMFTLNELETLVSEAGLCIRQRFGDYSGSPLTAESPRVLMVATRP